MVGIHFVDNAEEPRLLSKQKDNEILIVGLLRRPREDPGQRWTLAAVGAVRCLRRIGNNLPRRHLTVSIDKRTTDRAFFNGTDITHASMS